jgi:hypothetical protein
LNIPIFGNAEKIRMQIGASREKGASLSIANIKRVVRDLLHLHGNVIDLSVVAKPDEDAPSEPMDFLEARLQADIPVPLGAGRRYGREERFRALAQAYETWRNNGQLQ